jgi:hypothetical protein
MELLVRDEILLHALPTQTGAIMAKQRGKRNREEQEQIYGSLYMQNQLQVQLRTSPFRPKRAT